METNRWHLEKLRVHVREHYDEPDKLVKIINSIGRYIGIFIVHLEGARDSMKPFVGGSSEPSHHNMKYILGGADDQEDFMVAKLQTEAHFLGFVHSARSMFDVFAFLINKLLLNSVIREDRCDVGKVIEKLPTSELKDKLRELVESDEYKYVVAYINTSKHRYLIDQQYTLNLPESRVGIRVSPFSYNKVNYPEYWIEEALELVLAAKNRIIACGNSLNAAVLEKF